LNIMEERMRKIVISLALTLTPAVLVGQSSKAHAHSETRAEAQTKSVDASAQASIDAEIAVARERGLPARAIQRRVAEARAKGKTEAQAAVAARELRANFEAAHEAIVRAGRTNPREDEVERGGYAIERGYTSAQVEAIAKSAPADRSLVVAFDVLTELVARGVANENALAQVQSKLEARADDSQLHGLVTAAANANANANLGVDAKAPVDAGAKVGATVGGVIRKP
jgi:hypothetical protein